jgi:hypothetical protein
MSVSVRIFFAWAMIVWLPASLLAADTNSAVVHSKGGVWVNGAEATDSTVVFPGDLLETRPGFVANLDAEGTSVLIQPESVVKFQGTFLTLEHGSVEVGTSTSMGVHVNCLKVEPVSNDRTQYDVTDLSGTVHVAARKNDVNISQGALRKASSRSDADQSPIVHEGQQVTREEAVACGAASRPGGAGTNGLNSKWLEIGGGAGGGVVVLCLILCKGTSSSNVSPSSP